MRALFALGWALEAYFMDCDRFPEAADIKKLGDTLRPYLPEPPSMDGWGTLFRYRTTPDGQWSDLTSAGADGIFEEIPLEPDFNDMPAQTVLSDDFRDDIVYAVANFRRIPRMYLPDPSATGPASLRRDPRAGR